MDFIYMTVALGAHILPQPRTAQLGLQEPDYGEGKLSLPRTCGGTELLLGPLPGLTYAVRGQKRYLSRVTQARYLRASTGADSFPAAHGGPTVNASY